jgi:PrtD family type I secretion system ABC transporter
MHDSTVAESAFRPGTEAAPDPWRAAMRSLRAPLIAVGGFSALLNVLMLTGSVYMLQVYDRVLASGSVPTLMGLFAIVVVLYLFLGLYDGLRARMLARAGLALDRAMAAPAFRAWLRAGLESGQGAGADRPLRDLETLRAAAASPAAAVLFDLPFVPLYLGILFLLHPWLGLATVAGALIAAAIALAGRLLTRAALARAQGHEAAERGLAEAARAAGETVAAMGMERALEGRWRSLHDRSLAAQQEGAEPAEALAAASRAFRMLLQSAILTLGAFLVIRGEISAGMIIAASILSGRALGPIDQLVGQWRTLSRAAEAARRLRAFSAALPAPPARIALPEPAGRIVVKGLTRFQPDRPGAPRGAERPRILSDVSFTLAPGDALRVVGASAAGKSTLARLLVGALAPDAGEIRLDGATLDQYGPDRLARHIGYLPQRVEMLPGTVRDNIARFAPEATDVAVIAAARAAGVHEMILELPEGYATRVGGPDTPLSGGQMQRLGLARALYGNPALVVLDEPNSNLDVGGEQALNAAIERLRAQGATVVIMAHRASALAAVNRILVLEKGRVTAFGDKAEILEMADRPAATRRRPTIRSVGAAPAPAPAPSASPAP